MKRAEYEDKKARAKKQARESITSETEAKRVMENLDMGSAKQRIERDLTVLITVRETLKAVHEELADLAKEKANIELAKKLDLASQQLESIVGDAV